MVRRNPYSLILLDEIEKADAQVMNLFLQVFDAGRLTDGKGRIVHFNHTTIVMTGNIGTELYSEMRIGYDEDPGRGGHVSRSALTKRIKRSFAPEFLNRLDEIVQFDPLAPESIKRISVWPRKERPCALRPPSTNASSPRATAPSSAPATWSESSAASSSTPLRTRP
jgi:ATP-dependent Clp protease ATP-binding subunit ClpC